MKKTLILLFFSLLLPCFQAVAEDIVQILPVTTFVGATEDDEQYMEVQMVNDTYDEVGIVSFDMLLPEGIHFLYEDFEGNRVPFTKKGRNITYDFSLFDPTVQASGYTRYMLVPGGQLRPITGKSGTFMYLYFEVDANMTPGVYPIYIQETVIGKSETEGIYPSPSVSYIVVKGAESDESPLENEEDVSLSYMTGYVSSFIVEELNTELATNTNVRSIDLSGATELGAELVIPENVVYAISTKGGLKRTFVHAMKSTVCLPFALNAEQVETIKNRGCEIEILSGFDAVNNKVSFEPVTEMAANTPYLVTTEAGSDTDVFGDIEGVGLGSLNATVDVEVGNGLCMRGSFSKQTISSDANKTYYAYNSANGKFVRIGSNATVNPFRAYLLLNSASLAKELTISDDDTTGIREGVNVNEENNTSITYNLAGQRVATLSKGVYISNNKKYIVK